MVRVISSSNTKKNIKIDDLLIREFVSLIFDYGIRNGIVDENDIGIFVGESIKRFKDLREENMPWIMFNLVLWAIGHENEEKENKKIDKRDLYYIIKIYSQINPDEALVKIKYFLKKLNLNPNDEILNKYPTVKEFIQREFNTSQLMDYIEYLKYDDFNFPDDFYKDLIDEINRCYTAEAYSAVRILTRKLLENVLIDIFKKAKVEIEKYYDDRRKTFKDFSKLITLLKTELSQNNRKLYGMLSQTEIDNLINNLDNFRTKGNTNAHSIVVKTRKEDVDNEKDDLEHLIKVLTQRIYEKL